MIIDNRKIATSELPYVIAEISANHMGDFSRAIDLVGYAVEAGAIAVKLQTYTADTMTIDSDLPDFRINNSESLWNGRTLYDLYGEACTPWDWHEAIFSVARKAGLHAFSSAFDESSVDFLEHLEVPCYKIASFENTFVPLLEKVRDTNKPVIVSCGLASMDEIRTAHAALAQASPERVCLLACTSSYPADIADCNLLRIPALRNAFPDSEVGLSDHTIGNTAAIAAVALGATVFEKHLKLSENDESVDAAFSATPAQFKSYVDALNDAWAALGKASFGAASNNEKQSEQFRRSIYVVTDLNEGDTFTCDNIRCIRPGFGLPTVHFSSILGKTATQAISRGTPLSLEMVSD